MEYYSVIKNDEISPFATKWINLECIVLSEISQIEKAKNHMISPMVLISVPSCMAFPLPKTTHLSHPTLSARKLLFKL